VTIEPTSFNVLSIVGIDIVGISIKLAQFLKLFYNEKRIKIINNINNEN